MKLIQKPVEGGLYGLSCFSADTWAMREDDTFGLPLKHRLNGSSGRCGVPAGSQPDLDRGPRMGTRCATGDQEPSSEPRLRALRFERLQKVGNDQSSGETMEEHQFAEHAQLDPRPFEIAWMSPELITWRNLLDLPSDRTEANDARGAAGPCPRLCVRTVQSIWCDDPRDLTEGS